MPRRFKGIDLFETDALLTEEERLVRDTVRKFVDERVLPIIGDCFEEARFPVELVPDSPTSASSGRTSRRSTAAPA